MILLCLASSTTPRGRNLLVALAQYTVTHFRSSSTKSSSRYLFKFPINVSQTAWELWSQFLRCLNKITFSAILKMLLPFNRISYDIQRVTMCKTGWEDKEWCCVTANTILRIEKAWLETKNILKDNCGMFTKTVIQNNGRCIWERKDSRLIGNNAVKKLEIEVWSQSIQIQGKGGSWREKRYFWTYLVTLRKRKKC